MALCPGILLAFVLSSAQAQTFVSTGTKALPLRDATEIGVLAPSTPMHIVVGLKLNNADKVQPTLKAMATPGNALYGTSLTSDQFLAQFAPTAAQVEAVESYLTSRAFENLQASDNRLLLEADGTAKQVEAAFNTSLSTFSQYGKTIFANTTDAQIPKSLENTVAAVLGLNNIVGLHTPLVKKGTDPCTLGNCPVPALNTIYTPQDYQIAYDAAYPGIKNTKSGPVVTQKVATGSGTVIAILSEGNLTQVVKDLRLYEKLYNLPQVPVTLVNVGLASPDTSGADEWDLDSQTSTGIAQQVAHLYFYIATSLTDSDIGLAINKFASDNKAKALNISLGECEEFPYVDGAMLLDDEMFAEAALQGQTAFASSDDNGSGCPVLPTNGVPASGPPSVSYPASSPYVIAAGGTDLLTNADYSYNTETSWNSGGGGVSAFENPPFWESGIVPSSEASAVGVGRGVPDVAMCADPNVCGANIFVSGAQEGVGGTSLSSPLSVGSWARIESAHSNKLGFAAPLIYQLASGLGPDGKIKGFNDVEIGCNGAFCATPGWDYNTGLGSWDIFEVNKLVP
ncbi:MAG: S53 family peptidase [Bryobacteraceae bacterium]